MKFNNLFSLSGFVILAMTLTFTSCDDDDDVIVEPPVTNQIENGTYLVGDATSTDPSTDFQMDNAVLDGPNSRSGLVEAYAYLSAGSYNVVEYTDDVPTTYGGSLTDTSVLSGSYYMTSGDLAVDGGPITVSEAGLYHLTFDKMSSKLVAVPVSTWGVIGTATSGGWLDDSPISLVSASADEVIYRGSNISMDAGEFKFRYNNSWVLDLTSDVPDLKLFSNFGGSLTDLESGGENIEFDAADRGLYTITISYSPGKGNSISVSLERTGDIGTVTFDPADYPWALIGAATVTGWTADSLLTYYDWSGNWVMGHTLTADVFKYRVGEYVNELNPGNATLVDLTPNVTDNGDGNFVCSEAGAYFSSIRTDDDGATWSLKLQSFTPEVIGNATPEGNFDTGVPLTYVGEDAGVYTWEIGGAEMTADIFKFRVNGQWEIKAEPANSTIDGTKASEITADGDNMKLGTAGTYNLKAATSDLGATWTITID